MDEWNTYTSSKLMNCADKLEAGCLHVDELTE